MSKNANNLISGANWNGDISINEMMVFFGILIKMTLRPMPGQPYENAWKDGGWHPYTPRMALESNDDDGVEEIVTSDTIQFGARHEP